MNDEIITKISDVDTKMLTESLRVYIELKKSSNDAILFYRVGDFYETFFEDAILFSKTCDITLTSRKYGAIGRVALAGIPKKALDIYVKKLLDNNYKVARAEQFCGDNGKFFRKITRIYTPSTVYEGEFLPGDKNNYLAAIYKNGTKYGFSCADISQGGFYLTVGTKEEVEFEIIKFTPAEILLSEEGLIFEFANVIKDKKNVLFRSNYFSNDKNDDIKSDFKEGYLASNAIVNYITETQKEFAPKLDKVKRYSISNFMSMDFDTRRFLELTRVQADFKKQGSLFWFLDTTKTPMGKRLLREWMSAPLNNLDMILKRQRAIKKLLEKNALHIEIDKFLDNFCDLLRFSAKISNKTITFKELIEISKTLSKICAIKNILNEFKDEVPGFDNESLEILYDFSEITEKTLGGDDDFKYELYPIKQGVNARLDILRDELSQCYCKIEKLEREQTQRLNKSVKVKFLPNIGCCYETALSAQKYLDCGIVIKQKLAGCIRYANNELMEIEEKINSLKYSILSLEKDTFDKLLIYCCELTSKIREYARLCAYFDAINSLANCILKYDFSEVEFCDGYFELKDMLHPCVYKIKGDFKRNDTAFWQKCPLAVLTGANMSGKSTYLKQNAIAVILAQMCGYTCARYAKMQLFDRLFFNSTVFDNLKDGESTFFAEMKKIAGILNNSTKNSLILLDEPVKGTNREESGALLCAVLEYIKEKIQAKTLCATHFLFVAKHFLDNDSANVVFIDFDTKIIKKGILNTTNALNIALSAGIEKSIIENAKKYTLVQL